MSLGFGAAVVVDAAVVVVAVRPCFVLFEVGLWILVW